MVSLLLLIPMAADSAEPPRIRVTVNDGWEFAGGDCASAVDDCGWESVDLPHTWNRLDAFDDAPGYRRGTGWYRKSLRLEPELRGRRIHLHFEGANQVAELWVNGTAVGRHVGGYTAFTFDISDVVRWDQPNLIAVRVDNSHDPDIPPLNADFTFYGGIYRDVWLIATNPVRVTLLDHGSSGIFIDTPEVSEQASTVRVRGRIDSSRGERLPVAIENTILDADGAPVATSASSLVVPPNGSAEFIDQTLQIERPRFWSPDDPYLYTVRTRVIVGDEILDEVVSPLGVRTFSIDPDRGFFLNGRQVKLRGTNRHQDRAGYGNALPDSLHQRDVEMIKEDGFNFLRLAHYPQDPAILEATDRLGLIVWEEIPVVNLIGMSDAFAANSERMLVEMIRQHYNHPSIVFWGYMNEVMLTKPRPIPEGYYEHLLDVTKRLERRLKDEDSARLSVMALSRDEVPPVDHGLGSVTDVLAFNFYFGWYYEQLETFGPFMDDFHRRYPSRPLIVSEYGAGSDERVHSTTPQAFDFSSEYAQIFHRETWPQIEAREYIAGSAIWNQFDFGSEFRNDSKPTINQKGMYFFDRQPKDTAFYYRAALLDEPVLRIAREWSVRAGSTPEERLQQVWAYTNLDEVRFLVNGRPAGTVQVKNRTAEIALLLQDGSNEIRAEGSRGDLSIVDVATINYEDRTGRLSDGSRGVVAAVNAGSDYSYVDDAGVVWEADRAWTKGQWGFIGGAAGRTHHRIFRTSDDPLLQPSREGMESYRFDVADGSYEVELAIAERDGKAEPGSRVFSVVANGVPLFTDLDLATAPGRFTAVRRKAMVEARNGEGIEIRFPASAGKPLVSAILIRR